MKDIFIKNYEKKIKIINKVIHTKCAHNLQTVNFRNKNLDYKLRTLENITLFV